MEKSNNETESPFDYGQNREAYAKAVENMIEDGKKYEAEEAKREGEIQKAKQLLSQYPSLPRECYTEIDNYTVAFGPHKVFPGSAAYVRVPDDHPLYKRGCVGEDFDEYVNGGITFDRFVTEEDECGPRNIILEEGYWLGWDYDHAENIGQDLTEADVMADVVSLIKALQKYAKEDNKKGEQ